MKKAIDVLANTLGLEIETYASFKNEYLYQYGKNPKAVWNFGGDDYYVVSKSRPTFAFDDEGKWVVYPGEYFWAQKHNTNIWVWKGE